jgi:hypothetical protein
VRPPPQLVVELLHLGRSRLHPGVGRRGDAGFDVRIGLDEHHALHGRLQTGIRGRTGRVAAGMSDNAASAATAELGGIALAASGLGPNPRALH